MQIFHNRPLALSMCLFAVVAVAALRMERSVKFVLLLLSFCALLFVVFLSVKRRRAGRRIFLSFLCIVAVFAALFSSFLFFNVRYANLQTLNGSECEVEGTVLERIDSAAYDSHLRVRVTSLNGEKESMDAIFPLVKRYGGLVVALTLDEDGIPPCAEGRVAIAKKILAEAKK